jgi:hypothetical protein
MKMPDIKLLMLTGILVLGCNKHNNSADEKDTVINLFNPVETELTTSDIFSDLIYIPLETCDGSFISSISQYIISDNYIIVSDIDQEKVLLFTATGEFVHSIGNMGKGPGEYLEIRNISFIEDDEIVCITDISSKVQYFNISGKYLYSVEYNPGAFWTEPAGDHVICFYPYPINKINEDFQISIFDSDGQLVQKNLNRYKDLGYPGNPMANPKIISNTNEILFWEEYSDSVYSINHKLEIKPKFWFKYPNQVPANIKIKEIGTDPESWKRGMHLSNFIWTPGYTFIESVSKGLFNYLIYESRTETAHKVKIVGNKIGMPESLHGGITFWPDYSTKDIASMILLPHQIISHVKSTADIHKLDEKLIELSHSIDYDSNPVLVIGILK